jgi:hypothetical protein
MKPKKSFLRDISGSLMKLAFLAVLAAARGDLWLASTQWLLVAAVLGVFGLYARLEA